jgi:hypothetical protein
MHKPILFLGGMCGDVLLTMIDPTSVCDYTNKDSFKDCRTKKSRRLMKNFWKYNQQQKNLYYNRFSKFDRDFYSITHDTEYSKTLANCIQLHCSDYTKSLWFSKRFRQLNAPSVVQRVCAQLNLNLDNFDVEYANLIVDWQSSFTLTNQFDIKNIGKDIFLDEVIDHYSVINRSWAKKIYKSWQKNNNF